MDVFNNKITYRWNRWVRKKYVMPKMQAYLKKKKFTVLCNNCTGGFVLHDLGQRFDTPTINMYFSGTDFFDFVEHLSYYIRQELCEASQIGNDNGYNYPIAIIPGGEKYRDIELHFLHYKSFEEAKEKWDERKSRIQWNRLFVIWTFMGEMDGGNKKFYKRAQDLPVEKKVIFVNHPVNKKEYPDFYYIKGFENNSGLGVLSQFQNLKGNRYYDQFDFVKWFNEGE